MPHIFNSNVRTAAGRGPTDFRFSVFGSFADGETSYHFGRSNRPHWRSSEGSALFSELLFEAEKIGGKWQAFMEQSHQGVEHFRRDGAVEEVVLPEVHATAA